MRWQVPERVHCVFGGAGVGRNVADHYCIAEAYKGILEDHSQFAASEWSVPFALIQRTNAFLQRKQRLVDLRPINFGLLILIDMIRSSLIASKVDKRYFGENFLLMFERDLQDGMRA